MAKYLKLENAYTKDNGKVEVEFWIDDSETYGCFDVSAESVFTPEEVAENEGVTEEAARTCEALQKVISDLNKELFDIKNQLEEMTIERDRLKGVKADLLQSCNQYISQIKELEYMHNSVVDTYKDCIDIITSKICERIK